MRRIELTSALLLWLVTPLFGHQPARPEPVHYDRHRVVHHFYLYTDGGLMTLAVSDPSDAETRKAVRACVQRVSQLMVMGDLAKLREQFGENVPGLDRIVEARARKATITVRSSTPDEGSQIILTTADPIALQALHDFLRFQIADLNTGDSPEVRDRRGSALKEVRYKNVCAKDRAPFAYLPSKNSRQLCEPAREPAKRLREAKRARERARRASHAEPERAGEAASESV